MPIYEAKCRRCSTTFSYLTKVADREHTGGCPACEAPEEDTQPIISPTRTTFTHADRSPFK
jgi:putative FmdB family regulatory protein